MTVSRLSGTPALYLERFVGEPADFEYDQT